MIAPYHAEPSQPKAKNREIGAGATPTIWSSMHMSILLRTDSTLPEEERFFLSLSLILSISSGIPKTFEFFSIKFSARYTLHNQMHFSVL
jgi:hypothetical protein